MYKKNIAVLVIDNDQTVFELLRHHLEQLPDFECNYYRCNNIDDAFSTLQQHSIDIIYVNHVRSAGRDATPLETLRSRGVVIPIVVLVGSRDEILIATLMNAGATDCVPNERITKTDLSVSLRYALRHHELNEKIDSAEHELKLAAKAVENTFEGIVVLDHDGIIESINPAFKRIAGYYPNELIGQHPEILYAQECDADFYKEVRDSLASQGYWQGEIGCRRKNGETYPLWVSASGIYDNSHNISQYVVVCSDITERKQFEERLDFLAHHDPLTQLPNRLLFEDRLNQALLQAQHSNQTMAVMFMDLDRFKVVNDHLGHSTGDLLLRSAARRLANCMREGDSVSRLGGDEFTIILTNIAHADDVATVAQKILDTICVPYIIKGQELRVSASIGISRFPHDGSNAQTLIKNADTAMYRAKELGNNYQFYAPVMSSEDADELALKKDLYHVLQNHELFVCYQPKMDLMTEKIIGCKALLRWNHPTRNVLGPYAFIHLAEESGLIVPIGQWMLRSACAQLKRWQMDGHSDLRMTINLSARQFQHQELLETINDVLSSTQINANSLELEIKMLATEQNINLSAAKLAGLKSLGVNVIIESVGQGRGLQGYLKRFPADTLKIDKSSVQAMGDDEQQHSPGSTFAIARDLKLKVIAEGVETEEQLQFLRSKQCDEVLGFYFSRPVEAQQFGQLLSRDS
ncbi:MAG: EAL domain-containing protein [Gammaproteobacteria bacterium]|nr:EAL domain-containing protein [Gammaproteobacteria bacterium]